jgi:hypothetical protein
MISESKQPKIQIFFFEGGQEQSKAESPTPRTHTKATRATLHWPEASTPPFRFPTDRGAKKTEAVEAEPGAPAQLQELAHLSHQRDPGRSAPWPGARREAPAGDGVTRADLAAFGSRPDAASALGGRREAREDEARKVRVLVGFKLAGSSLSNPIPPYIAQRQWG